ncbi:unnamed protein product [Pylaiella littoralis]
MFRWRQVQAQAQVAPARNLNKIQTREAPVGRKQWEREKGTCEPRSEKGRARVEKKRQQRDGTHRCGNMTKTHKASSVRRGSTVLATPTMTSYGLFHQQQPASVVGAAANNGRSVTKNTTARKPASSSSSSLLRSHRGDSVVVGKNGHNNVQADGASSAPAFEAASGYTGDDASSSSAEMNQQKNDLLERHTSAAKDGVIDMLTAKASKLGASLERTLLAKREAENVANKLQANVDQETTQRKDLEYLVQQKQAEIETSTQENGHLKWEVDALRAELTEAEERSKGWLQKEGERRRLAEEAMTREHAVAVEYLSGVYREGGGPEIRTDGGATIAEVLVRELQALGKALEERDGELEALTERLEMAFADSKNERARQGREAIEEQLVFTQERFEAAKHKVRQLSGQLEVEAGDNEALRARLDAMEEENNIRSRSLQERKAKAQQRKRGDARDTMAESKAKDNRIKALESTLMQERARLEGELQSARSDYEDAAKESRRKAGRLQRRCLELEYRLATHSKSSDINGGVGGCGRGVAFGGGKEIGGEGGGRHESTASSETFPSSASSTPPPPVAAGLISAASMLPWRRGSASSSIPTSSALTTSVKQQRLGSGSAAAAAAAASAAAEATTGGVNERRRVGRARGPAAATEQGGEGGGGESQGGRGVTGAARSSSSSSIPNSSATATASGQSTRRPSADRLPDPAHHNDSAPVWMRADLAVDRVRVE